MPRWSSFSSHQDFLAFLISNWSPTSDIFFGFLESIQKLGKGDELIVSRCQLLFSSFFSLLLFSSFLLLQTRLFGSLQFWLSTDKHKHMKLCPDDICQMLLNKKSTSSQKRPENKSNEIERKALLVNLEQNKQQKKIKTNNFTFHNFHTI